MSYMMKFRSVSNGTSSHVKNKFKTIKFMVGREEEHPACKNLALQQSPAYSTLYRVEYAGDCCRARFLQAGCSSSRPTMNLIVLNLFLTWLLVPLLTLLNFII